ncbi:MAG: flagellar hook-length control protein FliK [Spirochaetota bacterium]|jgi:flagellar hook-length control protein FliK|nr:flagellar hook-length control protein FliK [Spirochaetota bacterium]
MHYDAGVALLARALPFETRPPGAHKQDSPEAADTAFAALLANALVRAPDTPLLKEAPREPDIAMIDLRMDEDRAVIPESRAVQQTERVEREAEPGGENVAQSADAAKAADAPREPNEAEGAEQIRKHSLARDLLEALDKVRQGIRREVKAVRGAQTRGIDAQGETKRTKLAEDIRGLLDLLAPLMPKKDMEALAKSAVEALAAPEKNPSKNGTQGQQGAVSNKGTLLVKLAQLLPGAEEAMRLIDKQKGQSDVHPQDPKQGMKHGLPGAKPRITEKDAQVAEVRDQRMNDPHSLRETVRVTHRAQRTMQIRHESAQPKDTGESSVNAVKPAPAPQTQGIAPAGASGAPKEGQQSFQFMQHNFTSQGLESVKKARAMENGSPLKNAPEIMKEIVEHARVTLKSGKTDMHLTLHPKSMGRITMHFSLGADGELSARLAASNESVRQYLQDNLSGFNRDLADAGVRVAQLEVLANGAHSQSSFGRSLEGGQESGEPSMIGTVSGGDGKRAQVEFTLGVRQHDGLLDVRA